MTITKKYIPAFGEQYSPGVYHTQSMIINGSDADSTAANVMFGINASSDDPVFLKEVRARTLVAHTGSGTITIGDSGDVDGWFNAASLACTTAVTDGTFKSSTDALATARGRLFSSTALTLDAIYDGITGGQLEVFVEYCVL